MPEIKYPETTSEWQEAVDLATRMLEMDAARKYGLIGGAFSVDVRRCVAIIMRGREMGITAREENA